MPPTDRPPADSGSTIFPLTSKPGIKRDGTIFDGDNWVDGLWTRFQRGRPRKMGGYRSINELLNGPIRQVFIHSAAGTNRIFCGSGNALEYVDTTNDGIGGGVGTMTPTLASGFVPSDDNTWQFAELYDAGSLSSRILAHAAPNLTTIDSTTDRHTWFGDIDGSAAMADSTAPDVSGGVCTAAPYAFVYGNSGYVAWCVPNLPDDWLGAGSGEARITRSKIVYGSAVRGGAGQSPAALFISLDAVIRATFVGGAPVWNFDTITSQSSILSSAGVIEYDGIFFWPGVDRFLMYNGVVQEVPNDMNINFFFDNLNWSQRQKVWATKVPRYGEIWWFYPFGNSTECNHAIILNVRENTWYDTAIERTAGFYPQVFRWPVWADVEPSPNAVIRFFGGTAETSSGGTAALAFDNDLSTECTQGAPDGDISYDFGTDVTKTVSRVGFRPADNVTLNLIFEYATGDATTWSTLLDLDEEDYLADTDYFFDLNASVTARAFRLRATGGGTLDMVEIYLMGPGYMIHQHEFGYDRIVGGKVLAIQAYIECGDIAYMADGPLGDRWLGVDRWVYLDRVEPDINQVGGMSLSIITRRYARDLNDTVTKQFDADTSHMDLTQQGRQMRLRWTSNTQSGFFEIGQIVLKLRAGDASQ